MGVTEDVEAYFQSQYEAQLASWRDWWNSNTKHGCFCGAGSVCETAIDALDSCCGQHDADYAAVGQSADTMWTVDGLIATRHADRALANCAGGAATVAGDPHSNPDPEGYRANLISLFGFRADVGDALYSTYHRLQQIQDGLDALTRTLLGSLDSVSSGDATAIASVQEHVAYVQGLEVDTATINAHLEAAGVPVGEVGGHVGLA